MKEARSAQRREATNFNPSYLYVDRARDNPANMVGKRLKGSI